MVQRPWPVDRDLKMLAYPITRDALQKAKATLVSRNEQGWQVLIYNRTIYAVPLPATPAYRELHAIFVPFLKSLCFGEEQVAVEFLLRPGDLPAGDVQPVFSWSKKRFFLHQDILFPYWSFSWIRDWQSAALFDVVPWSQKKGVAIWRGSTTGGLYNVDNWRSLPRSRLVQICQNKTDLCDAAFTNWVQISEDAKKEMLAELGQAAPMPFRQMSHYKYVIVVDGNAAPSSRFLQLLFSRSVILKQSSPDSEFYYSALEPWLHYLPVSFDMTDILSVIKWAQANDKHMEIMAERTYQWARAHIRNDVVGCHLSSLLGKYASMMSYMPELTPEYSSHKLDTTTVAHHINHEVGYHCM
jgi:hypothetical protein